MDVTDTTNERRYYFREPVSSNKWCKKLITKSSTVNSFPSGLDAGTAHPDLTTQDPLPHGTQSTWNVMEVGGATNFYKFLAKDTHRPHVI